MQESTSNGEKDNDDDDDDEEESVRNSQAQKILSRFTEEESDHLIELQEKHEELIESIKVFFESAVTNLLKEITQEKESLNNTLDLYQTKSKTKNVEQNQYYMKKIIKKYEQFFPDDDPLELFADRYKSDSFDVISKYDLGKQVTSENVDPDLNRDSKRRKIESSLDNYTPEAESLPVHDDISQKPVEVNQHGFVGNTILPNAGYFGPPPEHVFNTDNL
ncbi:hypothetical protein QCA50_012828 [Cerrena zonata]|uniref:Uncharacterized protein n=1 Tax=Cerrena zonata TaxID=2478898 RepID=A0AAW0FY01_9APHY